MHLTSETLQVSGIPTHVLRGGSGRPLLLLHGWGSTAERYGAAVRELPEDLCDIAIPDLPGFGATPAPPPSWGLPDYVAWTRNLLDALGWPRARVLGHSFGGRIAIVLGAQSPERLHGIILYASAGVTPRSPRRLAVFRTLAALGKRCFALPWLSALSRPARSLLYTLAGSTDYPRAGALEPVFLRVIADDLTPFLDEIRVPCVVLWGTRDRQTPFSDAERVCARVPGAVLRTVQGAGHAIHGENPARFARELVEILRASPAS